MTRRILCSILTLALTLTASSKAWGQATAHSTPLPLLGSFENTTPTSHEGAQRLIGKGHRHLAKGRLNEARASFLAASNLARAAGDGKVLLKSLQGLSQIGMKMKDYRLAEGSSVAAVELTGSLYGNDSQEKAEALASLAQVLLAQGKWDAGKASLDEALKIAEGGGYSLTQARALYLTGELHFLDRCPERAEPYYRRAAALFQDKGKDEYMLTLHGLALCCHMRHRYEEAAALFRKTLALITRLRGTDQATEAIVLNDLGRVEAAQGRMSQAEAFYLRALRIKERQGDAVEIATTLSDLADSHYQRQQYQKAAQLLERAVTLREKAFGDQSKEVADTMGSLANTYHDQGRYQDAEPLYKRALSIREKLFSSDHTDVAESMRALANNYCTANNYKDAEATYRRYRQIKERTLSPDDPDLANCLSEYATILRRAGNTEDSARQFAAAMLDARARAILSKQSTPKMASGSTSPWEKLMKQGNAAYKIGNLSQAESLYKDAVKEVESSGDQDMRLDLSLNSLATLYVRQGKYGQAVDVLKRSLDFREKTFGSTHQAVAECLVLLGGCHARQGDYSEASPDLTRALKIYSTSDPADDLKLAAYRLVTLGAYYWGKNRYEEGEQLIRKGLQLSERHGKAQPVDTVPLLELYANLLRKTNRCAEARRLESKARAIRTRMNAAE